jgi:hypothetical protein
MYIYMYIFIYIYVYIHTYMHTYVYVNIHVFIHIYKHTDRALCGGPEETDSEDDQHSNTAARSQLILANSKGI